MRRLGFGAVVATGLATPTLALEWFNLPFLGDTPAAVSGTNTTSATTETSVAPEPAKPVDVKSARVRILDKRNNRLNEQTLEAEQPIDAEGSTTTGTLNLMLKRCVRDVDGVPGQDVAWLVISENGTEKPVFEGWMFNLNPDVAALDHPVYDVRLMGCTRPGQAVKKPESATEAEAKITVDNTVNSADTESGAAPAPSSQTETTPAPETPANQPEPHTESGSATEPANPEFIVPGIPEAAPAAPTAPINDEIQQLIEQQ
jgi:hypothetical protein